MTGADLTRSALVISTTPPIPREYGNRNRVFQTIEFLKQAGFTISFLLYPFDEDWAAGIPAYYRELVDQFEYFSVVPNSKPLHKAAAGYHHTIDEWWDDNIGDQLSWLFKRKRYDILFVNYTFFSRAFDYAPKSVLRILDTHDLFTNRREVFEKNGVSAEFFYTNAEQEKIAFDRADAIIAIKSSEAEFIRTLTKKHVVTIPYWDSNPVFKPAPRQNLRRTFSHESPLRLGFIGAQNSVNVVNMRRFLYVFDRYVRLYNLPVEVVVAGNVCRELHQDYPFLQKLGRILKIEDFYQQVDAIIAPLEFSTGIKIKVGEALVWQLPVIATVNASDGFRAFHSTQAEASVASLCQSIASLATNEISYSALAMAGRRAAAAALKAQEKGFAELRAWIKASMRRILVITDRPFWYRGTFLDELITQAIEYVSHIAPTIVAVLTPEKINPARVYADVEYVQFGAEADLPALFEATEAACSVAGAILFLDSEKVPAVAQAAAGAGIEAWVGGVARQFAGNVVQFCSQRNGGAFTVSPLRYAPVISQKTLSERRVALLRPPEMTEWETLTFDYILAFCNNLALDMLVLDVPPYAEYSADFLRHSMTERASRIIMFESDVISRLFVLQAAQYLGAKPFVVGESFTFPQSSFGNPEMPSLAESLAAFLSDDIAGEVAGGPNAGWSKIWTALEN